jgi:hypothetical protein
MTEPTHDQDLAGIVQLADAYGLEYDLLLTLPGQVVRGTLIGATTYTRGVADVVQGPDPDDTLRAALAARLRRRAEELGSFGATSSLGDVEQGTDDTEDTDLPTMPEVEFVHLRDATASSWPDQPLPLWRGRLAEVAGWTLLGFGGAG